MKEDNQPDKMMILKDLTIGYRKNGAGNPVFGPLNADILPNEMVCVIGRNGVGKSTLLRSLAGLQSSVSGDIYLGGKMINDINLRDLARLISFVSTEAVNGFQMRVHEIIELGRFPYTGWLGRLNNDDKAVISSAIEHTGISHILDKPVYEISDGERQKVMIARALAQDTPMIILDEPTAFLDLPSRYEILSLLNELTLKNKTILFSTHDLNVAIDIADKIWLMSENMMYEGSPEDLLINDVFRKLFIDSPAEFDPLSMQFRYSREFSRQIVITGDERIRSYTQKAMKRIGIETGDYSDVKISIGMIKDKPVWQLSGDGSRKTFNSIYELSNFLKKTQ